MPWCPRRSAGGSCPAPTLLVVAVMVVEFSPTLQTATHVFPWIAVIYCLIRPLALATTHVMAVVVALFHRASQRRRDAREVLARHPFTRRS